MSRQFQAMDSTEELFNQMKSERVRLDSFTAISSKQWPHSSPTPSELAQAGLFYLLDGDRVQCAFCRGVISNWEPLNRPMSEHARHWPTCPFVMGDDVGNIPDPTNPRGSVDVCGNFPVDWNEPGNIISRHAIIPRTPGTNITLEEWGIHCHHPPRNPHQVLLETRLETFRNWPQESTRVTPRELAEAGFFYIGKIMIESIRVLHL